MQKIKIRNLLAKAILISALAITGWNLNLNSWHAYAEEEKIEKCNGKCQKNGQSCIKTSKKYDCQCSRSKKEKKYQCGKENCSKS